MAALNAFKPLSKEDLADILGVSVRTVENWVNDRILPAPTKLGNRVYWHPVAFYGWLDKRLSGELSTIECDHGGASVQSRPKEASKARCQPASAKTELEKVKNRTQAQLDRLMA